MPVVTMPKVANKTSNTPIATSDYLLRHLTLRQLQVFEVIYRLGSFTRAAEELFLTQPTVSMQIKKLSDAIGLPLFEHVGRRVEPTEAGVELYEACRRMFESLSNFEMKVDDMKGLKRGRLRLAVVTTAKYMAPEMMGDFSKLYPGIELALKVTNRDSIIDRMHNNIDDLYIMGQVPESELDIQSHSFAPNPLVMLAPREHPLVRKKKVSLEEIAREPFIVREPGSGMRDATFRAFDAKGLRPKVRMELGSNEAIKHAIVGGLGLSVMSLHTILLEGIDGPVAILDVEDFPIMRHWFMVYPKGKELSLVARTFLDFAIEYESKITKRMESILPSLKKQFSDSKKTNRKPAKSKKSKK